MVQRCTNKNSKDYDDYGGSGIVVCKRWLNSFENFLSDMGEMPEGMTIERKNNNGNYTPANCIWATRRDQVLNRYNTRLISFNGDTFCIREWERRLGLGLGTLWRRLAKGLPISKALTRIEK